MLYVGIGYEHRGDVPGVPSGLLAIGGDPDDRTSHGRLSASVSLEAAAMTAGAWIRPGVRDSRSIGPLTLTAATTLPPGPRTGAETEATPASRSATLWAQPRRRTPARIVAVKRACRSPRCSRSGSSQASRIWAADPAPM